MMTHQFMCLSGDLSDDLRPLRPGRGATAKENGLTTRARRLVGGATVVLASLALAVSPGAAQERDEWAPSLPEGEK